MCGSTSYKLLSLECMLCKLTGTEGAQKWRFYTYFYVHLQNNAKGRSEGSVEPPLPQTLLLILSVVTILS